MTLRGMVARRADVSRVQSSALRTSGKEIVTRFLERTHNKLLTSYMTSYIAILQLITSKDIEDLKEPAYMAQTYRLRKEDVEWAKDTAHALSKEFKLRKVSQTDIVRISFKLFAKLLASDKAGLKDLFERIK